MIVAGQAQLTGYLAAFPASVRASAGLGWPVSGLHPTSSRGDKVHPFTASASSGIYEYYVDPSDLPPLVARLRVEFPRVKWTEYARQWLGFVEPSPAMNVTAGAAQLMNAIKNAGYSGFVSMLTAIDRLPEQYWALLGTVAGIGLATIVFWFVVLNPVPMTQPTRISQLCSPTDCVSA